MLALALLLQTASPEIVVTGKRLAEAEAACRRGECTPLRDAQASIAFAEAQFRNGRYLDARKTLHAAVERNRDRAAEAPKPVAAIYEAYATVALHEGDQRIYKRAVAGRVRTLRDHLPAGDPAVVAAAPALGDMWLSLGDGRQADATYRAAEQDAQRAGQARAAFLIAIKRIALASATGRAALANRILDDVEARPVAQDPALQSVLRIVRFRIAARDADDAEMIRLVAAIGRSQADMPTLIWSPPYPVSAAAAANTVSRRFTAVDPIQARSGDLDGVQWVDVGFWVRPDGRTAEAEVLRSSKSAPWSGAILAQVDGRRYTARATDTDGAGLGIGGVYRVERITRRSTYQTPIGSNIRRRVAADGFETLDLTESEAAS